jgi:DNA-binding NarL/FixJ family response regulator
MTVPLQAPSRPRSWTPTVVPDADLTVAVHAGDWLSRAGIEQLLRECPGLLVRAGGDADVVLLVTDQVDDAALTEVRALRARDVRVVLVVQVLDDPALLTAVEAGVSSLLLRTHARPEVLARSIRTAAAGDGSLPPDLLGRLMAQVQSVQRQVLAPRGLTWGALSTRETDVLRLIADGYDTCQVATTLCWSERTVKNVVHDITTRLHLRNRAHAVAYAVRNGLI